MSNLRLWRSLRPRSMSGEVPHMCIPQRQRIRPRGARFAELSEDVESQADYAGRARLRVAIVAPSMGILGGQAVQAARLVRAWEGDPEVEAWLVPINPVPPGPFAGLVKIKYVRTVATQLTYLPLLMRELRQADVVHVFSASYFSFLLAPLPAVAVARLFRKPVVMNYRSGQAPD